MYIYTLYSMARKLLHSFYLDPALGRRLKSASKAEEMPQSQIVREAINARGLTHTGIRPRHQGRKEDHERDNPIVEAGRWPAPTDQRP